MKQSQLYLLTAAALALTGLTLFLNMFPPVCQAFGNLMAGFYGDQALAGMSIFTGNVVQLFVGLVLVLRCLPIAERLVYRDDLFTSSNVQQETLDVGEDGARGAVTDEDVNLTEMFAVAPDATGLTNSQIASSASRDFWREVVPALALSFVGILLLNSGLAGFVSQSVQLLMIDPSQQNVYLQSKFNAVDMLAAVGNLVLAYFLLTRRMRFVDYWHKRWPAGTVGPI